MATDRKLDIFTRKILMTRKPEYMGHTVNFRTKKLSYKDKYSVHSSPEDWIIFENTQDNYTCSTYSKAKSKFENKCTQHHVRTDVIRDLLLEVIKA